MNPFRRRSDLATQAVVLDTSGIIDGRIVQIAKAGFMPQSVVVPQFVIAELQFLADNGDSHKRERARYGLDIIRELQDIRRIDVSIAREKFEDIKEVDDKLVAFAKQYDAYLYTTDFNLNKVAQIEGVTVLNVNELAQALRPNLLPGEQVIIKLTQVGQDKTQGVGYLGDGTMVVVEQAGKYVGEQVQATCTRILQTQAGKMMFATLASKPEPTPVRSHAEPSASQPSRHQQNQPQHHRSKRRVSVSPEIERRPRVTTFTTPAKGDANKQTKVVVKQNSAHIRPAPKPQTARPDRQQAPKQGQQPQPQRNQKPRTTTSAGGNKSSARPRPQKRRLSPEDSLIATIKEIES